MTYRLICKSTDIIHGRGTDTVIVTGWTKPQSLLPHIPLDEFAVMGTLFSRAIGIEYLVRNLLANPQITCIHCVQLTKADDNSKSIAILKDLWERGAVPHQNHWKIRSRLADVFIQNDIPLDALFDLIMNVKLYVWKNVKDIDYSVPKGIPRDRAFELPFESKKVESLSLPVGHTIVAPSIPKGWLELLSRIRRYGSMIPNNWQGLWQELLNLSVTITFETDEFPDYLPCTDNDLDRYYELMCSDKLFENVAYTYGRRIKKHFGRNQLETVRDKMIADNFTNHGVVNLWDATNDIINNTCPCLTQLWFKMDLNGKVNAFATFRSNDMFSAWVQNAYGVRQIQKELVQLLSEKTLLSSTIRLGNLTINSLSAHIYDFALNDVDILLGENYKWVESYDDPIGSFLVDVNDGVITVYNEKFATSYEIKKRSDVKTVMQKICCDFPTIQPYHAMYLGQEIQKAFNLRTSEENYHQA